MPVCSGHAGGRWPVGTEAGLTGLHSERIAAQQTISSITDRENGLDDDVRYTAKAGLFITKC